MELTVAAGVLGTQEHHGGSAVDDLAFEPYARDESLAGKSFRQQR
jgi:hypothetical protein